MKNMRKMIAAVGLISMMSASAMAVPAQEVLTDTAENSVPEGITYSDTASAERDGSNGLGDYAGAAACALILGVCVLIPRFLFSRDDSDGTAEENDEADRKAADPEQTLDWIKTTFNDCHHDITIKPNGDGTVNLVIVSPDAYWTDTFRDEAAAREFLEQNGLLKNNEQEVNHD